MANKKSIKNTNREINDTNIDVEPSINIEEIKKEIVEYAENSVNSKIEDLVKKADRRIISSKNKSIFKRNIIILILLCLSGFLTYLLYNEGYFDKFFNHKENTSETVATEESKPEEQIEEDEETKLDKLKKEYSYLLDNINISEENPYLIDLYNGKLNNKMKLSIAFANIDKEKIVQDEDVYTVSEEDLKFEYAKLFNIDKYKATSFLLNDIDIKYLKSGSMYIFYEPIDFISHIKREIIGINVKDNIVRIIAVEGVVIDNILYNSTNEIISKNNISIIDNCKKLNKITYVFEKLNDKYILTNIEV